MEAKAPSESFTEMTELVLPQHTNAIGTAFGGVIMSWIDICSSIAAKRHCGRVSVTARVEALEFRAPIRVGDVVRLTARLNAAFTTSMEIGVRVEREHADTGERALCANARTTFVNLDPAGKPCPVPPLRAETDEDRRLEDQATERRRMRREARARAATS
jgi:acyl-CoA hydrolase